MTKNISTPIKPPAQSRHAEMERNDTGNSHGAQPFNVGTKRFGPVEALILWT